jgi:hypothetical protein
MKKRRRHPVEDRTYRTHSGPVDYYTVAAKLMGHKVVVWLPEEERWRVGYLLGIVPVDDVFVVKWSRRGSSRILKGVWRVHSPSLFTGTNLLPIPKHPARLPQSTNKRSKEDRMATKRTAAKASTATKRTATKKAASTDSAENGAKKTTGRTRGPDKLEGLSEAKKRNIAKLIFRERSKSPSTSWPDITQLVEDKYDWALPGSMTGRRLLREYGPDNAEEAIIKQDRSGAKKAAAKKTAAKKGASKKKVQEVEEPEDVEELEEDEELEDEEEEDLEEEEDEEDEDEDEDEEDEDEEEDEPEPQPAPKSKRVAVKRGGRSKKS